MKKKFYRTLSNNKKYIVIVDIPSFDEHITVTVKEPLNCLQKLHKMCKGIVYCRKNYDYLDTGETIEECVERLIKDIEGWILCYERKFEQFNSYFNDTKYVEDKTDNIAE
jgi:hypothetical protein